MNHMTNEEANYIRWRFKTTPGFSELSAEFPRLEPFLAALPDMDKAEPTAACIMEMMKDALKEWRKGMRPEPPEEKPPTSDTPKN